MSCAATLKISGPSLKKPSDNARGMFLVALGSILYMKKKKGKLEAYEYWHARENMTERAAELAGHNEKPCCTKSNVLQIDLGLTPKYILRCVQSVIEGQAF